MRLLSAAAVAAAFVAAAVMLSAPAFAQLSSSGGEDKALTRRTDAEKKRDAEIDREYRATLRRSGRDAAAAKSDPWGSVRGAPAPSGKR